MEISGNTILITGATSGIGRALAEALHARGNKVVIAGRRQQLLDEVVGQNPGMVGMAVDLGDAAATERFATEVKERFPAVNVLINNAGISQREDYKADQIDIAGMLRVVETNVSSVLRLSALLLPLLRAQKASTLMVTTSGLAFVPWPKGPVYSATKAFMHNWLDALRVQLRGTPVEVLELAPPYVQTELGGPHQAQDPRAMPLADYTREVMDILEGKKWENGAVLVEGVKPLRWAEKNGDYDKYLNILAAM